jgi:chromosome segregation ATPase
MKKLIILTISIIFAVSTFNPAYGQRGKKSQGKTTKAQDSTTKLKAVDPVLQPEKTPVPDASVAAEIESLRTEFGKLKASVQKLEKSGKQTTKRINELKTQDATLNTSINSMKASLGKKLYGVFRQY